MKRNRFKLAACHAFTLIELLIVVAIIGILVAMIVPVFTHHNTIRQQIEPAHNVP